MAKKNQPVAQGKKLAKQVQELKEDVEQIPESVQARMTTMMTSYSGPVPPPQVIDAYQRLIPNGGDRLLKMAEKEMSHRHAMDRNIVAHEAQLGKLGIILGNGVFALLIVVSAVLLAMGRSLVGLAPLLIGVGGFVYLQVKPAPKSETTAKEKESK